MAEPELALQQVVVWIDPVSGSVALDPVACPVGGLNGGVTWRFLGLPNTWLPVIEFERDSPTGPFLSLQQANNLFVSRGYRRVAVGGYPYRVRFYQLDAVGLLVRVPDLEAKGSVQLASPMPERIAPDVLVHIVPEEPEPKFEVHPVRAPIFGLDVVTWSFSGLPREWYPMIVFSGAPQALPSPVLGPFAALALTDLEAEGPEGPQFRITASGNVGPLGRYVYDIALLERTTHKIVHRLREKRGPYLRGLEDPVVDNNGPVIGTGGGT